MDPGSEALTIQNGTEGNNRDRRATEARGRKGDPFHSIAGVPKASRRSKSSDERRRNNGRKGQMESEKSGRAGYRKEEPEK